MTEHEPLVLWVGVRPGTLTAQEGAAVASKCRQQLLVHHFDDVECEIREAEVHTLAQPVLSATDAYERGLAEFMSLTAAIGQCVGSDGSYAQGTLGPYLRIPLPGNAGEVKCALTCRHVVLPGDDANLVSSTTSPGLKVQMPDEAKWKTLTEWSRKSIKHLGQAPGGFDCATTRGEKNTRALKNAQQIDKDLQKLSSDEDRRLGHVLFSPSREPTVLSVGGQAPLWLRDYAVIKLDPTRFGADFGSLRNAVYIAPSSIPMVYNMDFDSWLYQPDGDLLTLKGIVPADEIKSYGKFERVGSPHFRVGKFGQASGLTWGKISEACSIIRTGQEVPTVTWCVQSLVKRPFSDNGDSGACIWAFDGRVAGMLVGGTGRELSASLDITYFDLMEWILDDIRTAYPGADLI